MAVTPTSTPSFEFVVDDGYAAGSQLITGLANPGMAGLSAVDYLVSNFETKQVGHVSTHGLPDITPFSEGTPRHPIRLYDAPGADLTIVLSELYLPVGVADPFAAGLIRFANDHDADELTVPHGVPFPHGPEEHAVFYVATDSYRERHFGDSEIQPLRGGFLDGVLGELMTRSMETTAPPVGALVTPAHPPGPDLEGALLLLDALENVYGFEVDETELRHRSEELRQYYQELADRMRSLGDGEGSMTGGDYPEDRMFM